MALEKVHSALKRDQVVDVLREEIVSGGLRPGERIVESSLARQLGVSQTPVREALAALSREGLVVKLDHRGTFVSSLKTDELREVLTLRAVLEGYCARLVAERCSDEDLAALDALVVQMSARAEAGDFDGLIEVDWQIHHRLYVLSGHLLLQEVLRGLVQRMNLALAFANAVYSADLNDVTRSHVVLIDALRRHDPDEAESVMKEHVLEILVRLEERGGEEPDTPSA